MPSMHQGCGCLPQVRSLSVSRQLAGCRAMLPSELSPPVFCCSDIDLLQLTKGWAVRQTKVALLDIFMDAEFNGFGGELISIALVCEDGQEWYEVVEIPAEPHPFVEQHVLPVLGKEPIGRDRFAQSLAAFLASVPEPVIIADWPDDIRCLCDGLGQFGSGMRFRLGCTLVLLPQQPLCASQTTHNALLDARALRLWHAEGASAVACDAPSAAGL